MYNGIDPTLFYENRPNQTKKTGESVMGKDDFLKLLITQLQNQDPTNPMDDREFIAQMAQFSSLEQMTNMNKTLENFIMNQTNTKMFEFSHLIGKEVRIFMGYDENERPIYETNVVTSVGQRNDKVALKLADGKWVSEDDIVEISRTKETTDSGNPVGESPATETGQNGEQEQSGNTADSETDSSDEEGELEE